MDKLNNIAQGYLPTKKVSDLENIRYQITKVGKVNTKFGTKVVVDLNNEFQLFLPSRISSVILQDNECYKQIIEAIEKNKCSMTYDKNNCIKFSRK